MPSSPTDTLTLMAEVGTLYDEAFAALTQGELDRIGHLLDKLDGILVELADPDWNGVDPLHATLAKKRLQEQHGRLTNGIEETMGAVRDELGRLRRNRNGLRGYGRQDSRSGNRVYSEV